MRNIPTGIFFLLLFFTISISAQNRNRFTENPSPLIIDWDTNYYQNYSEEMAVRLYTSVKYTTFRIINKEYKKDLWYQTNRNIILGVGATYSAFTLNIGLNFPFVNAGDTARLGYTVYLDLQTHVYLKKYNFDFYAQVYSGYFLANSNKVIEDWPQNDSVVIRPDIISYNLGVNLQYIFNYRKFSYKAAFQQNAWQKKSAGTWVVGSNLFYIVSTADSSIIPQNLDPPDLFYGLDVKRQDYLNLGINGGYYYTLVIAKHFFVSLGLSIGPSVGYSWYNINSGLPKQYSGVNLDLNGNTKLSIGYNSRRLFIGSFWLQQSLLNKMPENFVYSYFSTGNFRILATYRIGLKKPLKFVNPRYWKFLNK